MRTRAVLSCHQVAAATCLHNSRVIFHVYLILFVCVWLVASLWKLSDFTTFGLRFYIPQHLQRKDRLQERRRRMEEDGKERGREEKNGRREMERSKDQNKEKKEGTEECTRKERRRRKGEVAKEWEKKIKKRTQKNKLPNKQTMT